MRNFLFLVVVLLSLLTFKPAASQSYHPLLADSTTWDTWECVTNPACDCHPLNRSFVNGDTIINSLVYKKISAYWAQTLSFCTVYAFDNSYTSNVALMREDTTLQKIWIYNESIGQEALIYDFSLGQGQTFVTSFSLDPSLPDSAIVDSVAMVTLSDGSQRKIIYVSFGSPGLQAYMIEGIGGSAGLYFPLNFIGLGFNYGMGCVLFDDNNLLSNIFNIIPGFYFGNSCPYMTGNLNAIEGKSFADLNSNQIFDTGDVPFVNKKITETNSSWYDFTDANGNYKLYVADTGNFVVEGQPLNNYASVPANHSVYFSAYLQTDSLNDFAYQPVSIFDDLEIYLYSSLNRSGMNVSNVLVIKNTGATIQNPIVVLHPDTLLQFVSSTTAPFSVTFDSIHWILPPLSPFQQSVIYTTFLVDTGLAIGTPVSSFADVLPILNDVSPANNHAIYNGQVVGPFDPNNISVDRDTILSTEVQNPPYLNYLIQFQNVGNDTAFNVTVENILTQYLDVSSFEFIASSHPVDIEWNQYFNRVDFNFDNIYLPDSNINESASHGFIAYRVKPKTNLAVNSYILNRASIYFDLNPPVITNYAYTIVAAPTGIQNFPENVRNVVVYPNPFAEQLNIRYSKGVNLISVMDISGRLVLDFPVSKYSEELFLNTSQLSKGIYLLKLTGENSMLVKKVIKL